MSRNNFVPTKSKAPKNKQMSRKQEEIIAKGRAINLERKRQQQIATKRYRRPEPVNVEVSPEEFERMRLANEAHAARNALYTKVTVPGWSGDCSDSPAAGSLLIGSRYEK